MSLSPLDLKEQRKDTVFTEAGQSQNRGGGGEDIARAISSSKQGVGGEIWPFSFCTSTVLPSSAIASVQLNLSQSVDDDLQDREWVKGGWRVRSRRRRLENSQHARCSRGKGQR